MEKHINLLFDQFEKNTATAQEKINEILSVISSGRVPEEIMVNGTVTEIDALRDTYSEILSYAKSISDDDMGTDKSISEIKNCIENSEKNRIAVRIQAVKAIMEKFIRVKSDIEIYVSELKPYQQKAREFVNNIESLSIENIEAESQGAKVFIDALENENPDSEYGYELICNAKNFFSERVVRGLDRDKYYLCEEDEFTINEANSDEVAVSNSDSSVNNQDNVHELSIESAVTSNADETVAVDKTEDYCYALNEGKTGPCKAAAFKSDIEKMNDDVRCIIPLLSNLGIMTSEQIVRYNVLLGGMKNNETASGNIEFVLTRLTEKGYVIEYKSGDSTVYCLSGYSTGCLQKESIKNIKAFWAYSLGQFSIANPDEKISSSMVDSIIRDNDLLYEYLNVVKETLGKREYGKVQASFKRSNSSYDVDAIISGETYKCRLYNGDNDYADKTVIVLTDKYDVPSEIDEEKIILCDGFKIWKHNADNSTPSDITEEKEPVISDKPETKPEPEKITEEKTEKPIILETRQEPSKQEPVTVTNVIEYEEYNDNHLENDVPSEESFIDNINELLNRKVSSIDDLRSIVVDGVLLAKAASLIPGYDNVSRYYQQLLLATDIPIQDRNYTDLVLLDAFQDISNDNRCIMLSAYMFALLSPRRAYDYGIASQADMFLHNFEEYFPGLEKVKPFFNKLTKVSSNLPGGFTTSIVALLGDEEINAKYLNDIKSRASELLITPKVKTKMRNLQPMYYSLFGQGSSLYDSLVVVQGNSVKDIDLVKITLMDYCSEEQNVFIIDDSKLENQVNEAWYKVNPGNKFDLDYDAKDRVIKHTSNRVKVLLDWYEMTSEIINKDLEIDRIIAIKTELIKEAQIAYESLKSSDLSCVSILRWMLDHIIRYLKGSVNNAWIFEDVLKSGIFSLNSNYVPIINPDLNLVKYYEPWRNAKKHIEREVLSLEDTRKIILEKEESTIFDNLNQLKLIDSLLHIDNTYAESVVHSSADHLKDEFEENIELAYTYSQISESEKEKLVQLVKQLQEFFYENGDFGCWRQFIFALKAQVSELTKSKKENLERVLTKTIETVSENPPAILLEAKKLLEIGEELNLAVVEEYINRYAAGENELIDNYKMSENTEDIFTTFYSEKEFEPILEECKRGKNRRFSDLAYEYVAGHAPTGWVTKHKDASKEFLKSWPVNRDGNTNKAKSFFSDLGFVVDKVTYSGIKNGNICRYKVYVKPDKQGKQEYNHPISAFGTQMKSPVDVIVLLGTQTPSQIVNTVKELDLSELAIVILDKPFSLSERRTMCETYHTKTSQQNPFILIDQTLCIYLALHQKEDRLPILLMATLPFTTYQPFVRDGGSTSDEMFCGRIKELRSIMDKNGASVVYGGRQLGKTALLERAAKRCNVPEQKSFAYYISIFDCDSEEKFVKKVSKEINKKTIGKIAISEECSSIEDLCDQLEHLFLGGKISELRLFIDEADKFLDSISEDNYEKLQPLIDLRRNTTNSFKFVLAGLHNVCRAQKATENNGVFGQLGQPLCVKPLSPKDAIELISKPLKYLGFQIDRFPHLETILTTTNYYPGILQFFGYTLVETLTNNYKSYYIANANPPFPLQKEQLASVINSSDLNESIKEKFKLSLKLDPRYFMLARCIAYRYHFENNNNRWLGYSIDEIKEVADSYPIHCLKDLTKVDYRNLLNEMVEMGILSPENDSYRLRKASFIDVIGRDWDKVDEEILANNG